MANIKRCTAPSASGHSSMLKGSRSTRRPPPRRTAAPPLMDLPRDDAQGEGETHAARGDRVQQIFDGVRRATERVGMGEGRNGDHEGAEGGVETGRDRPHDSVFDGTSASTESPNRTRPSLATQALSTPCAADSLMVPDIQPYPSGVTIGATASAAADAANPTSTIHRLRFMRATSY
jgi:hypothetical protein